MVPTPPRLAAALHSNHCLALGPRCAAPRCRPAKHWLKPFISGTTPASLSSVIGTSRAAKSGSKTSLTNVGCAVAMHSGLPTALGAPKAAAAKHHKATPLVVCAATASHASPMSVAAAPGPATRALVLGSGMAGLAAAQALSHHFDAVTVLEADGPQQAWSGPAQVEKPPRPGVVQYNFLHTLLNRGALELEGLCPGYLEALQQAGAHKGYFHRDSKFGTPKGTFASVSCPKKPTFMMHASRHLFEAVLRGFVQQNPNIDFRYSTQVTGLIFDTLSSSSSSSTSGQYNPEQYKARQYNSVQGGTHGLQLPGKRVVGVKLAGGQEVHADLVVVTTGRLNKVGHWLEGGGWPEAPESAVMANNGYVCWRVQVPPDLDALLPYTAIYHAAEPPDAPTGAYIEREEAGAWIVLGIHYNSHKPLPTLEQAMKYLKEAVYDDEVYNIVALSTPVSPVWNIGRLNNKWTHYEQVPPPPGLLVMGDAYCHYNPIYAKGMTVAAIEARLLDSTLEQLLMSTASTAPSTSSGSSDKSTAVTATAMTAAVSALNAAFYAAASEAVGAAWTISAGRDALFPFATVQNEDRGLGWWLLQMYVSGLFKVATFDEEVSEVSARALNMVEGLPSLLKPSIVAKVAAHTLTGWRWGARSAAADKTPSAKTAGGATVADEGLPDAATQP